MIKRMLCLLCSALFLCLTPVCALAENAPIPIAAREDMLQISNNPSGSYVLTADIDMSGEDWIPIPFSGTFDGNGHTLYNLTIRSVGIDTEKTYDGNRKEYETVFAGLFSTVKKAHIHDLNLVNAKITVETEKDCFIAALAGYAADSLFECCFVTARVCLTLSGTNEGVGGLIGFCDESEIRECRAESELTFLDTNPNTDCEEFLGGIYASGSGRIFDCSVITRGYAEIYGYAHNGGIVGMHKLRRGSSYHPRIIRSVSDCELTFFEVAPSRRCYRDAIVGEDAAKDCYLSGNTVIHYKDDYTRTERRIRPHACDDPEFEQTVTEPTCSSWGHTVFTCRKCGYSYTDLYTVPAHRYDVETKEATCTESGTSVYTCRFCGDRYEETIPALGHQPGEWTMITEPAEGVEGREALSCVHCGMILEERTLPALLKEETESEPVIEVEPIAEAVSAAAPEIRILLDKETLTMTSGSTAKLTAEVTPLGTEIIWRSADPEIVTVQEDGILVAQKAGTTIITCSDPDTDTVSSCTVTVRYTFGQILVRYVLFGWLWDK